MVGLGSDAAAKAMETAKRLIAACVDGIRSGAFGYAGEDGAHEGCPFRDVCRYDVWQWARGEGAERD